MWFVPFSFRDFIDIFAVALLMYWLYRSNRGGNSFHILTGIIVVYLLWIVVRALNMELLSTILTQIISVGAIAIVVLFQAEIRRFLLMIGKHRKVGFLSNIFAKPRGMGEDILTIVEVAESFSRARNGALIVMSQQSDLSLITDGGVSIDANLSSELLRAILSSESPLNHGAVVVSSGRIVAAKCILPVTQVDTLSGSLSTRHLSAIGLSEISDAVVISISNSRGEIAIARSGHLKRNLTSAELAKELQQAFEGGDEREVEH